ncbi:winged helix-turn-helix domain-containing protein [Candidatus Cloacimonadota bacterium]
MKISLDLARKIILNQQLIFECRSETATDTLEAVFCRLGYVQIDTINVVQRAHHHTLWSRFQPYKEDMLHKLQVEKKIFEYWGHAASYLPMQDYRYYLPTMERFKNPKDHWFASIAEECSKLLEPTIQRIRSEGPLSVSDFKSDHRSNASGWWEWKPAKKALELLFWQGRLMVKERRKFQKIYDLTENVLPTDIDTTFPNKQEVARYLILRAVQAQAVISERDIYYHITTRDKENVGLMLKKLLNQKKIVKIDLEKQQENYFAAPENIENLPAELPEKVYILSPFDNLIINRERLKKLFKFDYKLECYYPAAKRKFGYFTLPLLYQDRFIGRIDCKSFRKEKTLQVRTIFWEEDQNIGASQVHLAEALIRFAEFNNCEAIQFKQKVNKSLSNYIRKNYELR